MTDDAPADPAPPEATPPPRRVVLRGWGHGAGFLEQAGRPHHAGARPLGVAISGGGARSFSAGIGQLRALHALGLADRIGMISAVSGGAWLANAYAFAPETLDDRTLLGETVPTDWLNLDVLDRVHDGYLGLGLTQADVPTSVQAHRAAGIPHPALYGRVLHDVIFDPLGIESLRPFLALDTAHRADLLARNPHLSVDDVLLPRPERPLVVTGAALQRDPGRFEWFVPIELSPMTASVPPDLHLGFDATFVETAGIVGQDPIRHPKGTFSCALPPSGFSLADVCAASSHAMGSSLTRMAVGYGLSVDTIVPRAAPWTSPSLPRPSPLVDGGEFEYTGITPLLRRGFDRLVVFLNSNTTVGAGGSDYVAGVDGQIARLFGRPPSGGMYADKPLRLFHPEDLEAIAAGLAASQARGELPWHLGEHEIVAMNPLGLRPRKVRILWMTNEAATAWMERLPTDTRGALGYTGLGSGFLRFPHYPVLFCNTSDPLWLMPRQVNLLAHMWDHAVRARHAEFEALLA